MSHAWTGTRLTLLAGCSFVKRVGEPTHIEGLGLLRLGRHFAPFLHQFPDSAPLREAVNLGLGLPVHGVTDIVVQIEEIPGWVLDDATDDIYEARTCLEGDVNSFDTVVRPCGFDAHLRRRILQFTSAFPADVLL